MQRQEMRGRGCRDRKWNTVFKRLTEGHREELGADGKEDWAARRGSSSAINTIKGKVASPTEGNQKSE